MSVVTTASNYTNTQNSVDIDINNTANATTAARFRLVTYLANSAYNNTVQSGDVGIVFGVMGATTGFSIVPHSTTTAGLRIQNNGTVNAVGFGATSDYRIKDNVVTLGESISCIKLNPVQYTNNGNNREYYGFIAHEVQEHFPIVVEGTKDNIDENGNNILQQIHYSQIIPILVNDIKRLTNEINELREEIKILKEGS